MWIDDEGEEPDEIADSVPARSERLMTMCAVGRVTGDYGFQGFSMTKYTKEKTRGARLRSRDDQGRARRCRGTKGKARK
jgi:hypothetical protein